uniref:Uncharacterized protein n=1 Tax=Octopus bimaculoides TaxID=37653 RepID=A0A0L8G098_OCTBM
MAFCYGERNSNSRHKCKNTVVSSECPLLDTEGKQLSLEEVEEGIYDGSSHQVCFNGVGGWGFCWRSFLMVEMEVFIMVMLMEVMEAAWWWRCLWIYWRFNWRYSPH